MIPSNHGHGNMDRDHRMKDRLIPADKKPAYPFSDTGRTKGEIHSFTHVMPTAGRWSHPVAVAAQKRNFFLVVHFSS
jgi:hypothetical protein